MYFIYNILLIIKNTFTVINIVLYNIIYYVSYFVDKYIINKNKNNIIFYDIDKIHSTPTCIDDIFINLSSNKTVTIPPKKSYQLNLGIRCIMPINTAGIILPSKNLHKNLKLKKEYLVSNQENNIILNLTNISEEPHSISIKDDIAKIICIKYINPNIEYIFN
ncbi:unknown similar to AMEV107 [Adoxophyes honmai entomopoxvirus 'L']|uniref:dUTPase-like domain-containing protein n=1 Tax=Adoxophyes honmai entomopoxvirus 'L' TaxID=1293540 RepID=A0A916P091_9POXV|nr:unknown similar to AMEV107 [Adoxophyes honmai entomopoxvirus 'L']CCU55426.1 unknown similar to AMEV107 [Adoxophyes honmai entomopoxvirus 'L']